MSMEMPQPTEAHLKLARLAGEWSGEDTMFPSDWDPEGSTAQAHHSIRVAIGGFGVVVDMEQRRDGEVVFSGVGVWTVDPQDHDHECVLYWFDSIGMGMETFRGGWEGDVLTVSSKGSTGRFRLTYDLSEADTLRARMDTSPDGDQWKGMFEGTYRREA